MQIFNFRTIKKLSFIDFPLPLCKSPPSMMNSLGWFSVARCKPSPLSITLPISSDREDDDDLSLNFCNFAISWQNLKDLGEHTQIFRPRTYLAWAKGPTVSLASRISALSLWWDEVWVSRTSRSLDPIISVVLWACTSRCTSLLVVGISSCADLARTGNADSTGSSFQYR